MNRAASMIEGYTSTHCDGTPGLEYYSEGFAFVWPGSNDQPIEVSSGGYGEPVRWLIRIRQGHGVELSSPPELMAWFRDFCEAWLDTEAALETAEVTLP